jgi:hypothetical protein
VSIAASPDLVLGACVAICAAIAFGLGSAAQQQAVAGGAGNALPVRNPRWTAGVLAVGVGLALQVTALAFAPVALVQPLGVTSVLVAALAAGHGLDRARALGAVVCAGGLAAFLVLARPSAATGAADAPDVVPLALVLALAVIAALALARRRTGEVRAVALAVAAGACYGVSAGLLKVVATQVRLGGIGTPFLHGAVYAVVLVGPLGFVLSQHAFRQARSAAPVLAVLTTVDPLVAVAVGVCWLGEQIVTTPTALAGAGLAATAVLGGVVAVVRGGERQPVPT